MEEEKINKDVAIIVGRFQVPELTDGHKALISTAIKSSGKTIIFVGETKENIRTSHDPLSYEVRKNMIEESLSPYYGMNRAVKIFRIDDIGNYPKWVERLDKKIDALIELGIIEGDCKVYIWGSRDSVATKYKENGGKYDVHIFNEFVQGEKISGSKVREKIKNSPDPLKGNWDRKTRELAIWLSWKFENNNNNKGENL